MSPSRWLRHVLVTRQEGWRAFPAAARERIAAATVAAERGHRGEIRFAFEAALPWSYLWRDAPARERARMLFAKLGVWDTELNNGVLLYVLLADHAVEIVADRGIARRVDDDQWRQVATAMQGAFAAGRYEDGAIAGIQAVGRLLAAHFPDSGPAGDDRNELPDRPVGL